MYKIKLIMFKIKTIRAPKIAIPSGIPMRIEISKNITEPTNGIGKKPIKNTNIKKNNVCSEANIIIPCIYITYILYIKKFLIEIV